jgi:hypothetical protein
MPEPVVLSPDNITDSAARTEQAPQAGEAAYLDKIPDFPTQPVKIADVTARFLLQELARELRPNSQIRKCLRRRIPGRELVEIWRKPEAKRAYYQNLVTCGMAWLCANCSNRISEERRRELVELLGQGEVQHIPGQGAIVIPLYDLGMSTNTLQHKGNESAEVVKRRLFDSYTAAWSGKQVSALMDYFGIIGSLRSVDYTYSDDNGHHFHIHAGLIMHHSVDNTPEREVEISELLFRRWSEAVARFGGYVSRDAWDFQLGDMSIVEYVGKLGIKPGEAGKSWGQIAELTRHASKTAEGLTLWELLASYGGGNKQHGRIWLEATDALRGVPWLRYSRGLRARLGSTLPPKTDQELAREKIAEEDRLFAGLPDEAWQIIKVLSKRGEALHRAGPGDVVEFRRWLESLIMRRTHFGGDRLAAKTKIVSAGAFVPDWALEELPANSKKPGGQ